MNASIRFVMWGVTPIAALSSGLLAERIGPAPTLWIGLAGSMVFVAPVLFSPRLGMRRLPAEVQGH
ncbi:hypothetical protein HNP00_001096 [Arthrobacter sp. AZCC_0090]|nr:hypothetical protein [Arthrobacter sp. AZCC_0090]